MVLWPSRPAVVQVRAGRVWHVPSIILRLLRDVMRWPEAAAWGQGCTLRRRLQGRRRRRGPRSHHRLLRCLLAGLHCSLLFEEPTVAPRQRSLIPRPRLRARKPPQASHCWRRAGSRRSACRSPSGPRFSAVRHVLWSAARLLGYGCSWQVQLRLDLRCCGGYSDARAGRKFERLFSEAETPTSRDLWSASPGPYNCTS